MADEVRVSTQGSDGNGVLLDLKQRKLGLTGPNVALLMLILIIGGVAYLRTGTIDKTLKASQEQLAATEGRVHARVGELFGRMEKLIADVQEQNVLLTANNAKVTAGQQALQIHLDEALGHQTDLVHQQTTAIDGKVALLGTAVDKRFDSIHKYIEEWFSEIGRRMEWLDHNIANPDRRMPLRAPLPQEEHQPGRGR
jgi:hypothetical protein